MCLIVKEQIQIAKRDMVCFKIVNSENFRTPYKYYKYIKNKINRARMNLKLNHNDNSYSGFHSFVNKKDAISKLDEIQCIIKCIIPKGSKYYDGIQSGQFNANVRNYCSNQIIAKEIIKKTIWYKETLKQIKERFNKTKKKSK